MVVLTYNTEQQYIKKNNIKLKKIIKLIKKEIQKFYNLNKISKEETLGRIKRDQFRCDDEDIINKCIDKQKENKKINNDNNKKELKCKNTKASMGYLYKNITKIECRPIVNYDLIQQKYINDKFENMYDIYPLNKLDENILDAIKKHKKLQKFIKENRNITICWLDIADAYNKLNRNKVREIMILYGLEEHLDLIDFYDECEYIFNENNSFRLEIGIPQGNVCSTYIFSLCVLHIMNKYKDSIDLYETFVDDIMIGQNNSKQIPIEAIIQDLKEFGLELNLNKSKYIIYDNDIITNREELDKYGINQIKEYEYIKWLGVYYTSLLDDERNIYLNADAIKSFLNDFDDKKKIWKKYINAYFYDPKILVESFMRSYNWYNKTYHETMLGLIKIKYTELEKNFLDNNLLTHN